MKTPDKPPPTIAKIQAALAINADAVVAEIIDAFAGVTREGGMSWHETIEIDAMGSKADQAAARLLDTEQSWMELADP